MLQADIKRVRLGMIQDVGSFLLRATEPVRLLLTVACGYLVRMPPACPGQRALWYLNLSRRFEVVLLCSTTFSVLTHASRQHDRN